MVKLLVKNGAKLIKNDFGLTAINSARDNGHSDVMEYLVGCYSDFGRMGE
jgi:ankyrin repeat protein